MKKLDIKKIQNYLLSSAYLVMFGLTFYVANNLSYAFLGIRGLESAQYLLSLRNEINISVVPRDILVGVIVSGVLYANMIYKMKNRKNTRDKEEYGSARWGTKKDIIPYMDPDDFYNNIILSSTERIRLMGKPENFRYNRNKNLAIIGGSGSGKTYGMVKPNILQCHSSYVITDPKGSILTEVGMSLFKRGYKILVINLKDAESVKKLSMRYNPLAYAKKELEILTLVDTLIANTSGEKGQQAKEDFWVKSERLLYLALIDYIVKFTPEADQNFYTVLEMIRASEVREDDESFQNAVDIIFKELEENGVWRVDENGDPYYTEGSRLFCVGKYNEFKLAAGKTAKSILISCAARLSSFGISEISDFTRENEIDIHSIGEQKTALFVIISDTNATLNFLVSIFYTQLFNELVNLADNKYGGKLPIHVRCILDEFANIGQIPNFEKLIATIRSREISANIILQTTAQLKSIYKDDADTILGNCDTTIFLGGKEKTTLKEISEMLGKETIDTITTGKSRSKDESHSTNFQRTGRELKTQDELAVMDGNLSIVMVRGERPFNSPKYNLENHPRFKETADYDSKNAFDLEKYIKFYRHKQREKASEKQNVSNEIPEDQSEMDVKKILLKHSIEI